MRRTRTVVAVAAIAAAVAALSGCSAGSAPEESGPVTLTFWGGTNTDKVAAVWNASHPDIQVKAEVVPGGDQLTTKLLTAIKAGSGAPDVVGVEYQTIATLASAGALTDLAQYGLSDAKSTFTDATWNSVTLGSDTVWGLPLDQGAMLFYYREDILAELGIAPPKTWDEYAAAAKAVSQARPGTYLGTFDAAGSAWFASLTQQGGGSWYGSDGEAWDVTIDSAENQKVTSFWGDLVASKAVDTTPMFTPEWNAALAAGTQIGWTAPVWGAGVLASNAPDTAGKWGVTALPQWKAGDDANGSWGGGAEVVTSQSQHPEAAAEFVKWLTTDKDAITAWVNDVGIYPATTETFGLLDKAPEFMSNVPDFYEISSKASQAVLPVTYGPNVNVAYSTYSDEFGKAVQAGTAPAFLDALSAVQNATRDDLEKAGFTVK
ncbi:ABC transporter substrate-binding protein [Microbacterium sp. RURRCA19A]|uniref:ABC transporter substrate-binding protein n=1 Tax=Microbacterium sp. RURRCA19A TaxID=1907391 RepID=UPI000956DACE|nr:extracellular solute-binding protein [Microbacterium sp. RURRCA19A]SIS11112.1 multiple sugar transport system substrate-binding protein [Microbacterium sp. RURRCA19A]